MSSPLPPDPYKLLGVSKDATLAEIRSAHRKLVLKCHPDKVQDAALKAVKQDEFQKVQQAYELLTDDKRRTQYDEQAKLFELRKEMGRGVPTARSNPFEYEVRTAEPRTSSTPYARPPPKPAPKVYSHPPPRSYEDVLYEEPLRGVPRKSTSYESTDRKRTSTRDEDRERDRRRHEDEETRARYEKEKKRDSHGKKEKSKDKERRRAAEEKHSRATAYVEDFSEDELRSPPRTSRKKSSREMEEEIRQREDAARAMERKDSLLDAKWEDHKDFAGQYMQQAASRRKVDKADFHPGPLRRAETFGGAMPAYNIRYATPTKAREEYSDDERPRRSSAHKKESRRASDTPARSRDAKPSSKESRRSPAAHPRDPYIVEPPSPPPPKQKPALHTFSSAPPNLSSFATRKEPSRSKTSDYPRQEAAPSLPRSQTFQPDGRDRGRDRGGSRLKHPVKYDSSDSDSDSPVRHHSPRYSHSPPPMRSRPPEPQRYIIDNGRSVPVSSRSHRSDLRNVDPDVEYSRDRSESPRGGRHGDSNARPPLARNSGSGSSRQVPTRSHSHQTYYSPVPEPPDAPIIREARPKMSPREGPQHKSRGSGGNGQGGYFGEVKYGHEQVKYAPQYGHEHVIYAASPNPDAYRRGSDPTHHRYDSYSGRGRSGEVYVS